MTIYLAGGCFWGVEAYFKLINGVTDTEVGYSGGSLKNPSYYDVTTGVTEHAETTKIVFDTSIISPDEILQHFWRIHNPTLVNRQGNDVGSQYRSAIFYTDNTQLEVINKSIKEVSAQFEKPIVTQVAKLESFYPAEEYHQDYLDKNPGGYCHVNLTLAQKPL